MRAAHETALRLAKRGVWVEVVNLRSSMLPDAAGMPSLREREGRVLAREDRAYMEGGSAVIVRVTALGPVRSQALAAGVSSSLSEHAAKRQLLRGLGRYPKGVVGPPRGIASELHG